MDKFSRIFLTLFFYISVEAATCMNQDVPDSLDSVKQLSSMQSLCDKMPMIKTNEELKESLEYFYKIAKMKDAPDRHMVTKRMNLCSPTKDSKVLIIAFEGTGAYEPLVAGTMALFNKCFGNGKVDSTISSKIYATTREIYKADKKKDSKWSGLQAGVMSSLTEIKDSNKVDWYSFPSEEVEQLAGLDEAKSLSLKKLYGEIKDSIASNPKGIQNARDCIKSYMTDAWAMGIEVKVVVVSHSSGGRSLVKFAEHVKKDLPSAHIDLAFSIDPVKEAHHAIEEVVPQKAGEPIRYLQWKMSGGSGKDYPYSAVWTRDQPHKLYKPTNVENHINFYQNEDRLGLKVGGDAARFGIHGSPMQNAENIYMKGQGISGHGSITYDKKVLDRFEEEIKKYLD